ncbi:MAG: IS21 family transposase [Gemmataceae bacterium]|nr:IS21 family transposase [Gemmataceae bacterium]
MGPKLSPEEIVTLQVLKRNGQPNTQIAHTLGVTEGAVRYHLRRAGQPDRRGGKPRKAEALAEVIDHWVATHQPTAKTGEPLRPANVRVLFDHLQQEHDYTGSYKSVLRFVRDRYGRPRLRPFRRVETPPGAQAQVDWGEFHRIDIGDGPQTLYGFVMVLSHSRKETLIWCRRMDQLAWHHAHTEAFRRLGGIPAVLRIDNLKTGVGSGAGPWGQVNDAYRSYANGLGFHVDACLPRCPEDKGKVENKVGNLKRRLHPEGRWFDGLGGLQVWTDSELERAARVRICPATGESACASWLAEQKLLRPLPATLPLAFDVAVTRTVQKDCTVSFEGRTYSVPFVLCGLTVQVHGCAEVVQMLHQGRVVAEHPRHSRARLLLDPSHYDGPGDERVTPPVPLGKMGQKLQEILQQPVEQRPLDLYAALAEVAR